MNEAEEAAVRCSGITMAYAQVDVLRDVDLCVASGESVAVMGPSGTGKTTLLAVITGLIVPTSGQVEIDGVRVAGHQRQRARMRQTRIGLLFQSAELLDELSVLDNVAMPQIFDGEAKATARGRAAELLNCVGLQGLEGRRTDQLSGGQAQRVAVARALSKPSMTVLVADEPTASLDQATAQDITTLILEQARARGAAVLLATHDERVAARCERTVWLPDINGAVEC